MEAIPRPEFCAVCHKRLPQGKRGRPRITCGSRCRKRKERAPRGRSDEFYRKTRKAWQQIKAWERRFGALTQTYPEWGNLTLRDRLLIRLQRGWEIDFCTQCERPYMPDAPDAKGKYCGDDCHNEVRRNRRKAEGDRAYDGVVVALREQARLLTRHCKHCGVKFAPTNARQVYHRSACRTAAYRKRWGRCVQCGEKFEKKQPKQKCCTHICNWRFRNHVNRMRRLAEQPSRVCVWCGKTYRQQENDRRRRYCRTRCMERHNSFKMGESHRLPRKSPLRVGIHLNAPPPLYRD